VCKERQLESLYFSKYPLWEHPEDGKIHPQIRNCGTATRRPSGSNPNIYQVAKGSIRSIFPASEGSVFVSIDLANQELVILAAESKDPVMLDAFLSNPRRDIHSVTSLSYAHNILSRRGLNVPNKLSYELFQEGLHSSDKEIAGHYSFVRNKLSKGVNFLLAYLGGYATLAENLLISQEMAKELMSQTFSLYGRVQPWQQETIEFARTHSYSEMAYGSRRHVTDAIHSDDDGVRKRMERQVVNAVVQGTAAEILKKIRQEVARTEMRERYDMRSVFMIYDEVTANVPMEKCEDYIMEMAEIMRITPPGYPVGMEVDASVGKTWGTQKEIGVPTRERIREVLGEL
jgi:DNA polymerase-1